MSKTLNPVECSAASIDRTQSLPIGDFPHHRRISHPRERYDVPPLIFYNRRSCYRCLLERFRRETPVGSVEDEVIRFFGQLPDNEIEISVG